MLNKIQRCILANILNKSPDYVFFHEKDISLTPEVRRELNKCLEEYNKGKPLSKIIHKKEFWNHEFYVTEDTLDPRQDSEVLIESVLANVDKNKSIKILDIGTGTGCLVISLLDEMANATAIATDISEAALNVATINAHNIINSERVEFIKSNYCDTIDEKFDIIVSNPPYIRSDDISRLSDSVKLYDPIISLDGGEDGLDAYRKISCEVDRLLSQDGLLFLEVGYDQMNSVCNIFKTKGFSIKSIYKDTLDIERVVVIKK